MSLADHWATLQRHSESCLLAGIAAAGAVIYGSPPTLARDLATAAVVGVIPGMAFVPWLGIRDRGMRVTLVLLISLSLTVLVAQAVMYTFSLRWVLCTALLLGMSAASTSARIVARARRRGAR